MADEKTTEQPSKSLDLSKVKNMDDLAKAVAGKKLTAEQTKAVNMKAFELGMKGQ